MIKQHASRFLLTPILALAALSVAQPAIAHVEMDHPNFRESFTPGSTVTIAWHDTIQHGPADYDLWYSISGPEGPWLVITQDLEFPNDQPYRYDWTVPDMPSEHVRIRVRQDNGGPDYEDISDQDSSIAKTAAVETVVIDAFADATLYEESGDIANGSGAYLFTGRTENSNGGAERRALLTFDIAAAVPTGATITGVSLDVTLSRTISGAVDVGLHRVLQEWQEGDSDPSGQEGRGTIAAAGDTTWTHREYPGSPWSAAGASFTSEASTSTSISGLGGYSFPSSPSLVADVQAWLDDPSSNFGWAVVADSPGIGSAKRFNSRENGDSGSRPQLTLNYEVTATPPVADFEFSPIAPKVGDEVVFTDLSTGTPETWAWDFGDGGSSTEQNPTHVFATQGSYQVMLTVSNNEGSDSAQMEISVTAAGETDFEEITVIPAAANASGSGDSFFISTVDILNDGPSEAQYRLLWLPRDTDNSDAQASAVMTIDPGAVERYNNVLLDVFGLEEEVGALIVESDSPDIEVMSRTFNQAQDGTFGQGLPGVSEDELIPAGERVKILFLSETDDFRSNLGLINGSAMEIEIQWQIFDANGASLGSSNIELQPWENTQINQVLKNFAPVEAAYIELSSPTTGGLFTCYGSVLDNLTSDPTTVLPR